MCPDRPGVHTALLLWGAALVIVAAASPRRAEAQACCGAASTLTPARLAPVEQALISLGVRASHVWGTFDQDRAFHGPPPGAGEFGMEQDLAAALRVFGNGQTAIQVPVVETWRHASGATAEHAVGLGDVTFAFRYDLTEIGAGLPWPGIALLGNLILPTGVPVDRAQKPLASDATGTGAFQAGLGLGLEQAYGDWLLSFLGVLTQRFIRTSNGVSEQLGLDASATAAVGYLAGRAGIALLISYEREADARIDGRVNPDTGRAATTLGLAAGLPLTLDWRAQGQISTTIPISGLGMNQDGRMLLSFSIIRVWN